MMQFVAGLVLGLSVGVALAITALHVTVQYYWIIAAGVSALMFIAGAVVERRRRREIRLTGRVFEFPQGPVMVEIALRRMSSILPAKVTQSE